MALDSDLLVAVKSGDAGIVGDMLREREGLGLNSHSRNEWSYLSHAAKHGQMDMVRYLLEQGAEINTIQNTLGAQLTTVDLVISPITRDGNSRPGNMRNIGQHFRDPIDDNDKMLRILVSEGGCSNQRQDQMLEGDMRQYFDEGQKILMPRRRNEHLVDEAFSTGRLPDTFMEHPELDKSQFTGGFIARNSPPSTRNIRAESSSATTNTCKHAYTLIK